MPSFDASWQNTWVNINGEFVKGPEAAVSVLDWSFVYGHGVFEGVSMIEGKILNFDRHVDRLYRSANRVGIEIPIAKDEMGQRWVDTARKNSMEEGYMRPLVSRGEGPLGIHNHTELSEPNIVIIPQVDRTVDLTTVESVTARISSVRASSPVTTDPRVKANHYIPNILAVTELEGTNADIPIMLDDDGFLTEAGSANLFVVNDDTLSTPPKHRILVGTTRNALLDLCESADLIRTEVTDLTPYDLYAADECFVTGSSSGVKAITQLNTKPIGSGTVGPVTKRLGNALSEHLIETGMPIA